MRKKWFIIYNIGYAVMLITCMGLGGLAMVATNSFLIGLPICIGIGVFMGGVISPVWHKYTRNRADEIKD